VTLEPRVQPITSRDGGRARISIVVPILDEAGNIPALHHAIGEALQGEAVDYEVIFVDDGSRDDSVEVVRGLNRLDERVKLLSLSRNFGHQVALTAGLDVAHGNAVITMDGDLQHPARTIPELLAQWRSGYEIVYTVRRDTLDAGPLKRVTSVAFYKLFRLLTGMPAPPGTADFRLLDAKVVAAFRGIRERTRYLRGLTSWVGFRSVGVPYVADARRSGRTKYGYLRMGRLAVSALVSFSSFPLYAAIYVGASLSAVSFLYGGYVLWIRFVAKTAVTGWASVVLLVAAIGGIQLLLTGVVGLYLAKIYEEVKQRPLYLVRDAIGVQPSAACAQQ
jgi:polyisoprenyl-phosphate glycosyltransferase